MMRPKFRFHFGHSWHEIFGKNYNWRNFTFVNLEAEWGTYKGRYIEVHFGLLGAGCTVEIYDPLTRSVFGAEMDQRKAEAMESLRKEDEEIEREGGL